MSSQAPRGGSVDDWLRWQLSLHDREIELGLERVGRVASELDLLPWPGRAVVVAGTNGKGSCATLIASLASAGGCRVGLYTSPHLWRYNERIRIDDHCVDDDALGRAFEAIEDARGDTPLTYFEYGTLAALWLFARARVDLAVLEVGLGGRLDAVNIVDADVALITNIGLDHMDWLGADREQIGAEKAGVLRAGQPAFCTDRAMPDSIARHAAAVGASLAVIGRDFDIADEGHYWHWRYADWNMSLAAHPAVLADNLAAALCVATALGMSLTAADGQRACAVQARLPGRRQQVDGRVPIIYDVGHNAEAVSVLVQYLMRQPVAGRTHVVLGMLMDKPVEAVGAALRQIADVFYPAGLQAATSRGLSGSALAARLGCATMSYADPAAALAAAQGASVPGDRIVVCGSFFTVAQACVPEIADG